MLLGCRGHVVGTMPPTQTSHSWGCSPHGAKLAEVHRVASLVCSFLNLSPPMLPCFLVASAAVPVPVNCQSFSVWPKLTTYPFGLLSLLSGRFRHSASGALWNHPQLVHFFWPCLIIPLQLSTGLLPSALILARRVAISFCSLAICCSSLEVDHELASAGVESVFFQFLDRLAYLSEAGLQGCVSIEVEWIVPVVYKGFGVHRVEHLAVLFEACHKSFGGDIGVPLFRVLQFHDGLVGYIHGD